MSSTDSSTEKAPSKTFYEEIDIIDAFQLIDLSPQTPPECEEGQKPLDYVSKSPIYPLQMTFLTSLMKAVFLTWKMKKTT